MSDLDQTLWGRSVWQSIGRRLYYLGDEEDHTNICISCGYHSHARHNITDRTYVQNSLVHSFL